VAAAPGACQRCTGEATRPDSNCGHQGPAVQPFQRTLQALTESEETAEDDSACASRWIICSTKLYDEVAELDDEVEDPDVEAAGVVSVTFEPSA
jgi:hypothetical protein